MNLKSDNIKLSVIVPVYNAHSEGRIHRLLNCLCYQTADNIEFILIVDAPTDGTDEDVKRMTSGDSRFHVVYHSKNIGIGLSRNEGIGLARGKYIAFADHDDELRAEMYQDMIDVAEKNEADIVVSPARIRWENGNENVEYWDETTPDLRMYFLDRLTGELSNNEITIDPYPLHWRNGNMWNKIFRKAIIDQYCIEFVDTREACYEDVIFQIEVFANARRVVGIRQDYYTHIFYPTQSNTSYSPAYMNTHQLCNAIDRIVDCYYKYPAKINKYRVERRLLLTIFSLLDETTWKNYKNILEHFTIEALHDMLTISAIFRIYTGKRKRFRYLWVWFKIRVKLLNQILIS